MKRAITSNFRGLHALVVHGDDMNRETLVSVLGRLGLSVTVLLPDAVPPVGAPACDLLLFDADEDIAGPCPAQDWPDVPVIALIGSEAPSRLARVVGHRCDSHILKPIRTTGVFTAILLAVNGHQRRRRHEREMENLRQRLSGRREVTRAVLHLMSTGGIDEEAAYEALRQEAMNRRVAIEEVARGILGAGSAAAPPPPRPGLSRKA
ncbi:MAG: ANTAR domain-containing protein [Rhodobacteraceae bacterium]|jgi:AmiR/NasT family two-component response regulator|nr:ANTAR domain-containing protein [Paracoccaceae bacterium]